MKSDRLLAMEFVPITSVRTPEFGVCLDEGTPTPDRCVLSKDKCAGYPGTIYKTPSETEFACKDPDKVEIGRCTSSLDDNRCGASEAACGTKSPFYETIDPLCSLVSDKLDTDANLLRTTFPACQNNAGDFWQCVLDDDECFVGERKTYAKWADEWGPRCTCEHVPTGICYQIRTKEDENSLTPENSFCSNNQDDCPSSGYFWMSARAFAESEFATYKCRLCDENKVGGNQASYEAGGCLEAGASQDSFDAARFDFCALESVACKPTASFVSSERLKQWGLYCPIERTNNWGTCTSSIDPVECTNKAASCLVGFQFEASNGNQCDIHGHFQSGIPTYFPYCSPRTDNNDKDWKDIRCVWGEAECDPAKERWEEAKPPDPAWFPGCRCEDVFTGVCKEPSTGEYHCAVSAQACTDPASYVLQLNLETEGIDMTCQLCAPSPTPTDSPVPPPTMSLVMAPPPTFSPVVAGGRPTRSPTWPTAPAKASSTQNAQQQQREDLSQGAIIGIAVAGVVACALIAVIYTLATRGSARKATSDQIISINNEENPEIVIDAAPNHDSEPVVPTATIT